MELTLLETKKHYTPIHDISIKIFDLAKKEQEKRMKEYVLNKNIDEKCCICKENPPNIIIEPCGHCCICENDFKLYQENNISNNLMCQLCKTNINNYVKKILPK